MVSYFEWLGECFTNSNNKRNKFVAASRAIRKHEKKLIETMMYGYGNVSGLSKINKLKIIGELDNPAREGLVSMYIDDIPSAKVVKELNIQGVGAHLRKADHYSGIILNPLKQDSCVRISLYHYNSF